MTLAHSAAPVLWNATVVNGVAKSTLGSDAEILGDLTIDGQLHLAGGLPVKRVTSVAFVGAGNAYQIDCNTTDILECNMASAAAVLLGVPLNPVTGAMLIVTARNVSGSAGIVTFNAIFKQLAFTQPTALNQKTVQFYYSPQGNWVQCVAETSSIPVG